MRWPPPRHLRSGPRALVVDDARFDRHAPLGHHPERPERLRAAREAIAQAAAAGVRFDRVEPRTATDDELVRVHDGRFIEALSKLRGERGYLDPDTYVSARQRGGGSPGRGIAHRHGRRDDRRPGLERRGSPAPARAPRATRAGDGILPPQQRGGGRRPRTRARPRARGRGRLGRAPRQRHAGDLLRRSRRALRLDPPVSLLPGNRRGQRDRQRRGRRVHRERAPRRRRRRRGLRERVRARRAPGGRELRARSHPRERRVRRLCARSPGADAALGGRLWLDGARTRQGGRSFGKGPHGPRARRRLRPGRARDGPAERRGRHAHGPRERNRWPAPDQDQGIARAALSAQKTWKGVG